MGKQDTQLSIVTKKCVVSGGLEYHSTTVEQEGRACRKQKIVVGECVGSDKSKAEIDLRQKPLGKDRRICKAPLQAARHHEEDPAPPFTAVDYTKTASATLNEIESEVVVMINQLRRHPKQFAESYLAPKKERLTGTLLRTKNTWVKMIEGRPAIEEAEAALSELEDEYLEEVQVTSRGLILAARDLASDIGEKGLVTHRGTDESTLEDRLRRYANFGGGDSGGAASNVPGVLEPIPQVEVAHELISFGVSDPAEIISQLVIDDGTPTRHDRRFLLDPRVKKVGVAFTNHRAHGHCCVITLTDGFQDLPTLEELVAQQEAVESELSIEKRPMHIVTPSGEEKILSRGVDAKGRGFCAATYSEVSERLSVFGHQGYRYHRHSMVCRVCKSSLQSTYYVHLQEKEEGPGSVYCADCVKFRFPLRCFKCHVKLEPSSSLVENEAGTIVNECTTTSRGDVTGIYGEGKGILPHCSKCFDEATVLIVAPCEL